MATKAPDASVFINTTDPAEIDTILATIRSQPGVVAVWPASRFIGRTTVAKDWYYPLAGPQRPAEIYQPLVDLGRLPDEGAVDEVAISKQTALNTGLTVGSEFSFDVYSPEQFELVSSDSEIPPDGATLHMRVVGVLRDVSDVSAARSERLMLGTAALYDRLPGIGRVALVKLDDATTGAAFIDRLSSTLTPDVAELSTTHESVTSARAASRVIDVGLWCMAAAIVLAGLVVVVQIIRRNVAERLVDDGALLALGLDRRSRAMATATPGLVSAMVAGVATVVVAIAASPLFPVGRPRSLEPAPGIDVDVVAISLGALATLMVTAFLFVIVARVAVVPRRSSAPERTSKAMNTIRQVGPLPVAFGVGLVRDRGVDASRNALSRSIVAVAVGIAGLVASATFVRSLDHLAASPAEYGMDFDLSMEVPTAQWPTRSAELVADDRLEMVGSSLSTYIEVNGRPSSATALEATKGSVAPTVTRGRAPMGTEEVALGPGLSRELGAPVGSHVEVRTGDSTVSAEVVGLALESQVTSEDYVGGLVVSPELLALAAPNDPEATPPYRLTLVRFAPGADPAAVTAELDGRYPWSVMDESFPAPPAAILTLIDVRVVPVFLAWFFAAVTVVALATSLVAAGRRHRRSMAVVRGLGMGAGGLRLALWSLAAVAVGVALAVGVPVGLFVGDATWSAAARSVDVVPNVSWPVLAIIGAVPVLLLAGALATLWPAHRLLSHPVAEVLRAE